LRSFPFAPLAYGVPAGVLGAALTLLLPEYPRFVVG